MGPSSIYYKNNGPIHTRQWGCLPKQLWAHPNSVAASNGPTYKALKAKIWAHLNSVVASIIKTMMGPSINIGGTSENQLWAHSKTLAAFIKHLMGPSISMGSYQKNYGPI
jgi:hypothetical protein